MPNQTTKLASRTVSLQQSFKQAIKRATGRADQVIVIFVDVRGFSAFSSSKDSVDIALYIRRLFISLINKYFPRATFHKSTGDGMLIIYRYDEKTLKKVATDVIQSAVKLVVEFSAIAKDDNMITSSSPESCGVGINRGTVCCIEDGNQTLDYAGHVLNLAARLLDVARPAGIVMHGSLGNLIPVTLVDAFETSSIYVRGIAENQPVPVYSLKGVTSIPVSATLPISEAWGTSIRKWKSTEVDKIPGHFSFDIPNTVKSKEDVLCRLYTPGKIAGLKNVHGITDFVIRKVADKSEVSIDFKGVKSIASDYTEEVELILELKFRQA